MELELGCKLTKRLDDFAYVDLLIAKDRTGPVFISKETGIMFILTAHLKGYTRDQIKIDINEDGSKIVICGEKPAQEMVMVGWKVYKKEIEMRGFRKAFKIPDGVILDKIKARFKEDESMLMLTISMPKAIEGVGIEDVEEEEEIAGGNSESLQVEADEEVDRETLEREESAESDGKYGQNIDKIPEKLSVSPPGDGKEVASKRNELLDLEGEEENEAEDEKVTEKPPENMPTDMQEHEASKWDQNGKDQLVREKKEIDGTETQQEERSDDEKSTEIKKKKFRDQSTQTDAPKRRPKKCCAPMIAGSAALLVPLMVFVIHLIRPNDKPSKKKQ